MVATYTFDVFSTLDGFGSYDEDGDWGGYWGKEGPEFIEHRLELYRPEQRMVLGGETFREFLHFLGDVDAETLDPLNTLMRNMPTTVISSSVEGAGKWPDATVTGGDGAEIVARLKAESAVPLRSHGSLTLNRSLLAAGLVDFVQVTIFPVISGRTGTHPVLSGAADYDLELVSSRTFDGRIQELTYRPTPHGG